MTNSLDTSDREAEDPRGPFNLPIREMRAEPVPHQAADPIRAALQLALEAKPDELPAALSAVRAALAAQQAGVQVPPGYKLVPVEPTSNMLAAMSGEWHSSRHAGARKQYAAMLAAAPEAPARGERDKLRTAQAAAVMPMIGCLLDAWAGLPNDIALDEELSELRRAVSSISEAMEAPEAPAQAHTIIGWLVSDTEGDDEFVNNPSALEGRHYKGRDPLPLLVATEAPAQPTQAEAPSGVTREDIEGARALMDMSEAEIDDELRRLGIDPDVAATKLGGFLCRLCGKDRPHAHSPEDVVIFRNGVKSATQPTQGEAPSEREAKPCLVSGDCKHGGWCSEVYCQERCQFVKELDQLDALAELCDEATGGWDLPPHAVHRIGALARKVRAALASQPQAEAVPVAPYCYVYEYDGVFGLHREFYPREWNGRKPDRTIPLYLHQPTQASQPQAVDAEDTARIDALEGANAGREMWIVARGKDSFTVALKSPYGNCVTRRTLREAIDAARRAGGAA